MYIPFLPTRITPPFTHHRLCTVWNLSSTKNTPTPNVGAIRFIRFGFSTGFFHLKLSAASKEVYSKVAGAFLLRISCVSFITVFLSYTNSCFGRSETICVVPKHLHRKELDAVVPADLVNVHERRQRVGCGAHDGKLFEVVVVLGC